MSKDVDFRLPFEGKWHTVWGGDTKELNNHHDSPIQKYAFDFIKPNDSEKLSNGAGRNEDYDSFAQNVLAPADGTVIEVVDGVRDNEPGNTNVFAVSGNYVLIKHEDNLFSFLAHFKQGSLKVRAGDKVKQGDMLGLCGNSGNSSQPHLHFHLQDSDKFYKYISASKAEPVASSIKCSFSEVVVEQDGQESKRTNYSPVRGDIVKQ